LSIRHIFLTSLRCWKRKGDSEHISILSLKRLIGKRSKPHRQLARDRLHLSTAKFLVEKHIPLSRILSAQDRMTLEHFLRNATLTTQGPTFPIFIISYLLIFTSHYLYVLYDIASYSNHYAFLYHFPASSLIAVPFALSFTERRRFESLGYSFRWNQEAICVCIGYCLVTSVSGAYVWTYWIGDGAFAAACKVSSGWLGLMGVNLVPLWFGARPLKPMKLTRKEDDI
jgi:hypothetical protein